MWKTVPPESSIPSFLRKALLTLVRRLGSVELEWAIDGSVSLALQGVEVTPNDIDILTDRKGAYKISKLFEKNLVSQVRYRSSPKFKSYFGKLKVNGVWVEIMGNLRTLRMGRWSGVNTPSRTGVKYVSFESFIIPVVPLSFQAESGYLQQRLSRDKK